MSPSPLSRRKFLGTSLKAGAGAAALGLTGVGSEAWASALSQRTAAGITHSAPQPPKVQRFVSRPDIIAPGVSVVQSTDVASIPNQPQYIFLSPRPNLSTGHDSGQPIETQGLMITDLNGRLIWWQQMANSALNPFNFRVQQYKGEPVLTWTQCTVGVGFGADGTAVVADSSYTPVAAVTSDLYAGVDLHEFLITPEDTALVTSYQFVDGNPGIIYGHALELDIPSNGTVLFDWSSEGHVPEDHSFVDTPDYFHINSIDLWPGSERNVLISSRNTWCVYLIDRVTGDIIWRLGGKVSDFDMGPGTRFSYAHDARPLLDGSGLSLFDDASPGGMGADDPPEKNSWGKVFNLDQVARRATLRHQFMHPDMVIDTPSQGNNQLIPTGGHFVGWGALPYFTLFAGSGSTVRPTPILDGCLPITTGNYRAFMNDWVGTPPLSELALVVHADAGTGNFTAYMSWNGATEIDSWRINAGTSTHTSELSTVARKQKNYFETIIPFTRDGATEFQAIALDVNGTALGRSTIVKATSPS